MDLKVEPPSPYKPLGLRDWHVTNVESWHVSQVCIEVQNHSHQIGESFELRRATDNFSHVEHDSKHVPLYIQYQGTLEESVLLVAKIAQNAGNHLGRHR